MLLEKTIGHLYEEELALRRGLMILKIAVPFILVGSILETNCFYMYNGKWHPFAKILEVNNKSTGIFFIDLL